MQNNLVFNRIFRCLEDCKRIIDDSTWMTHIINAIQEIEEHINEPMQLAIVGRISSSKSTLVNAILKKPEFVTTGHEAETYNVSWLKYGKEDSPIILHFKNGSIQEVPRNFWKDWSSHSGNELLKNDVKYIEVFSNNEILKHINIIDTPGLDATSRIDSENTINFLQSVQPDAVILLFTESLSNDSLKLIQEFQNSANNGLFSLNPMNALGLLSKADMKWEMINEGVIEHTHSMIKNTLLKHSDVRKALFQVLPISALMGVASFCITEEDLNDFIHLTNIERKHLVKLFIDANYFTKDLDYISIDSHRREQLLLKYGLYGIFICIKEIQRNNNVSIEHISKTLQEKSGYSAFIKILKSHFVDRASLIKIQRSMMTLIKACNLDKQYADNPEKQNQIKQIHRRVMSIENDLHELAEWRLLLSIYEEKCDIKENFMQEIFHICGEYGHAAINKLDVNEETSISEMINISYERSNFWHAMYNVKKISTPAKAEPYAIVYKSYKLLYERLKEQHLEFDKALSAINIYNNFIYGKEQYALGRY